MIPAKEKKRNKLIFFSLLSSLLFCNYSYAQTSKPTVFKNGIQGNSNIFDSDGNNLGNLSSLISTANNAIPKSQIGVANGVAPLDSNSMMSVAVSGDISNSTLTSKGSSIQSISVTNPAITSNTDYIHNYGNNIIQSNVVSSDNLQTIINNLTIPTTLHAAAGEYVPVKNNGILTVPDNLLNYLYYKTDGTTLSKTDEENNWIGDIAWNGGNVSKRIGDSVLVESFEPKFGIMRDREFNNSNIYDLTAHRWPGPIASNFYKVNTDINIPSDCTDTFWCHWGPYESHMFNNTGENHSKAGMTMYSDTLYDYGLGYGGGFGVMHFDRVETGGTDWNWNYVFEHDEIGSYNVAGYTNADGSQTDPGVQQYNQEIDYSGIGPDDPRVSYDPLTYGKRKIMWYNQWYNQLNSWAANTKNKAQDLIGVKNDTDGITYMYTATVDNGITGATQPAFKFNEANGSFVSDGTQKWAFLGAKRYEVGCGFCFYPTAGMDNRIGTYLAGKGTIIDSPIDMAQVNFVQPIHAVMRAPTKSYYDLSADGTKSGQNNVIVGFGDTAKYGWDRFEIATDVNKSSNPTTKWGLEVDGTVMTTTHNAVTATGTTISDATKIVGDYTQITHATAGSGVILVDGGLGDGTTIHNISGLPIKVYPIDTGWSFVGNIVGQPIVLLHGQTLTTKILQTPYIDYQIYGKAMMTKADIISISSPSEGQTVFDKDDHTDVTYRCPTSTTCGWFPVQYGTALSN